MIDTAILTKPQDNALLGAYSSFVGRLAANKPHTDLVPARVMRAVLTQALADRVLVDQAKKALMYGKDGDIIRPFRESILVTREMRPGLEYPDTNFDRLHAALGMRSEADEILQQELTILCGGKVTEADQVDEGGDLLWYAQLYARSLGVDLVYFIARNAAKLMTRYKGLVFSETAAKAPDRAAEAAAQAGVQA